MAKTTLNKDLIDLATQERNRGLAKWGHVDKLPPDLMIAIVEEIGEVAHAINHGEEDKVVRQEIAEVVGLLDRLWDMYW